ncbi:MAG TPA: HIT domain-containing protein [Candidatus Acidoferrales bacterium]|nr:HIT domain-containing protein [Candidatus Acidoferrales bacterium]
MIDRTRPDCLFCKIVRKEIPARELMRTDEAVVFYDLNPMAPTHLLVVPARHADNLGEFVAAAEPDEVGRLFTLASTVARGAAPAGYRIVVNEGTEGGQTVSHLHLHILGGRHMTWPPG